MKPWRNIKERCSEEDRSVTLVSAVLSLYTIACSVAIVVEAGLLWPALKALWETTGKKLWPV